MLTIDDVDSVMVEGVGGLEKSSSEISMPS